jgi:hypothetical protein
MNVCLGGSITSLITLTATGATNGLNLCSINGTCTNKTSIYSGLFTTCTYNPATSFCGCIVDCGEIIVSSKQGATENKINITPNTLTLGNTITCLCTTAARTTIQNFSSPNLTALYIDTCQSQMFSGDPVAGKFAMTTWSNVTPSVCISAVNSTCSVEICVMPNALTVNGCATFQGIQYIDDYSANYTVRSLVDKGYAAPINNPTLTGTLCATGNVCLIGIPAKTTETCVVYIDVNNKLSKGTVSGGSGGIAWVGTTANGIGTYVNASCICSQPNLTYNGTKLGVSGCICATNVMCATDYLLISDKRCKTNIESLSITPINIEYKQFNLICEPNQLRYGVIAQELQLIHPELVKADEEGILGVSYTDLLVKEVAYLKHEINELKCSVNELKNKL